MYEDEKDALAAEYVLGTLSADEREQVEALASIDPGFAKVVAQWERRLGELNVMVEAVEPPPEVWHRLRVEVGSTAPAAGEGAPVSLAPGAIDAGLLPAGVEPRSENAAPSLGDAIAGGLAKSLAEPAESPREAPAPRPEPRIERSTAERGGEVIYLARRVRQWRQMTAALGALAAVLAIYIGLQQFAPGLVPFGPQPQTVAAQPPGASRLAGELVAALQQEPTGPAFLLTIDPQSRTLIVRRVSATAEAGRSYELWLISSRFSGARSLGVIGGDEFTQRPIPSEFNADTIRTASYAVSLEPAGGSKSKGPTGPILFTGKLVDAAPRT
jgi:anti-sigma-K factor RskA